MNVTTGNRRQSRTLVVFSAIVVGLLLLAAAAAGAGGSERKQPSGSSTQSQLADTPPVSVQLPDLHDPIIRQRFVDSFAPGYFGL